jgi:hypothetical protein
MIRTFETESSCAPVTHSKKLKTLEKKEQSKTKIMSSSKDAEKPASKPEVESKETKEVKEAESKKKAVLDVVLGECFFHFEFFFFRL